MIGRLHHVVLDCPDPAALAEFYAELLGLPITYRSDDWVVIAKNDTTSGIAFQRAADYRPPQWPDPDRPQQFHLDVMVDDREAAGRAVMSLGARQLANDPVHVYADPAGHPFCLIRRPGWAPPVHGG
jgi:catechol 2,3-dioxygenase-like lactoylglutathione lyase family enzyme